MSKLLEITSLRGGYEKEGFILQGIDLTLSKGEAVGIIGLNGSGKSTLGKAIVNLIPYRRCRNILYNGKSIENNSASELAQRGIVLMHQGGIVFPNLTVWENLSVARGRKIDKDYFEQLESAIPLLRQPKFNLMHIMSDTLSGGQRHELALAMTLLKKPQLVIMDEPSAGLSPKAVQEIYAMLSKLREALGLTILLIEQNINQAVEFCDRCLLIEQGRVRQEFVNADINEIEAVMFGTNTQ